MTDCERALLKILNTGVTKNITYIALEANVSYRHARRCFTNRTYTLSELVDILREPGLPARIIIKSRKDIA